MHELQPPNYFLLIAQFGQKLGSGHSVRRDTETLKALLKYPTMTALQPRALKEHIFNIFKHQDSIQTDSTVHM